MTATDSIARPSQARLIVLAFLCTLTFVLYLDRVCIQQALQTIRDEFGLSELQGAYVLMAFQFAYGIFEVPMGHWGDRIGSRAVLTRIAVCWSIFTALTGACTGLYSLLVVRFLFGIGEAGALPNVARVIARWFPPSERGRVNGLVQTTMVLGGAASPIVAAYIIEEMGWRWSFVLFGLTGIFWAGWFWWWFRDDPARHPAVNSAELELLSAPGQAGHTHHEGIPWRAVLHNPSVWLLSAIMTFSAFNSYIYLSWFSTYLQKGRGISQVESGQLASLVLTGAAAGMFAGGFFADLVRRFRWDVHLARRCLGASAFLLAAGFLAIGLLSESAWVMGLFAALSIFSTTSTLSNWWSTITEISGRHVGAIFGLANGIGFFGALGSQYVFGLLADYRGRLGYTGREQWDWGFYVAGGVLVLAAVTWACLIFRPIETDKQGNAAEDQAANA